MSNDPTEVPVAPGSIISRPLQPVREPAKFPPIYANFVSLSGAAEEVILDFGMNTDPAGQPNAAVNLSHRLVLSYFTAKRLAIALEACLGRQEAVFGVVDTDIARRIATQSQKSASAQTN